MRPHPGATHDAAVPTDTGELAHRRFVQLVQELGREAKHSRGWKSEVARRIGVHPSHLSRIISGKRQVGPETLSRAADQLGISLDFFAEESGTYRKFRRKIEREQADAVMEKVGVRMMYTGAGPILLAERLLKSHDAGEPFNPDDVAALIASVLRDFGPLVEIAQALKADNVPGGNRDLLVRALASLIHYGMRPEDEAKHVQP